MINGNATDPTNATKKIIGNTVFILSPMLDSIIEWFATIEAATRTIRTRGTKIARGKKHQFLISLFIFVNGISASSILSHRDFHDESSIRPDKTSGMDRDTVTS
mmetsp:Transcript_20616/g.42998  ORF Transcript_20616/g.42998 Transcript_20616/m.42998 type:complete len:104 (+) Transcript_20616:641-952(+)